MKVYLAWVNDMVLGVYRKEQSAVDRLSEYRRVNGGKWQHSTPNYWTNEVGQPHRMAAEVYEVK